MLVSFPYFLGASLIRISLELAAGEQIRIKELMVFFTNGCVRVCVCNC